MEFDIFSPSAFLQLTGLPGKDMIPPVKSANLAHVASSVHQAKGNFINPPVCSHTARLNTYSQAAELIFPDNLSNRNSYPEVKLVLKEGFYTLVYHARQQLLKGNGIYIFLQNVFVRLELYVLLRQRALSRHLKKAI